MILVHTFYLHMEAMEKNVFVFGAHMNSSVNVDNKGKGISILGKDQYGD